MTRNATLRWKRESLHTLSSTKGSSVDLDISFDDVDWEFAQKIYGWSAFQYQAWLKGGIVNHDATSRRIILHIDNILEIWVNDIHIFGGDFYGFDKAPVVMDLHSGVNEVSIRLVREIRSQGGSTPPTIQASVGAEVVSNHLQLVADSIVLPDAVNDRLCSRYGSVVARNQADGWVTVHQLEAISNREIVGAMYQEITLAPGQSRPLKMTFDVAAKVNRSLNLGLKYSADGTEHKNSLTVPLEHTSERSMQKITFLHPSGAVSYAMLRPPSSAAISTQEEVPVLLVLHGAGVEASGPESRHSFDDAPDLPAWVLIPTGMTPWSSDDWHTWGFADAQAAVASIPEWINSNSWKGPGVKINKILVAGHSNGGQGTWYVASHQPDTMLGAVAASGYSSIENYVPYVMWNEADTLQSAILSASKNSFRHEVLIEDLAGIPIFQQHGSADDNVPAYHSRLMNSLLAQSGQLAEYSELPNGGHWFEGAMTTQPMVNFYMQHLNLSHHHIAVPDTFTFVVPNSHDMGSKYGLVVDQLATPDRLGKILVTVGVHKSRVSWHVRTQNIHRFHLDPSIRMSNPPHHIFIDELPHSFDVVEKTSSFVKSRGGVWSLEVAIHWKHLDERYGHQRGPLDSILRSAGPFEVVYDSNATFSTAIQTSRNFLQYYGADTIIVPFSEYENALERKGNVIVICLGSSVPSARLPRYPIHLVKEHITITTRGHETIALPIKEGMGGVWLRPLPDERLELVVWGCDEVGLRQAARLIPTLTGAGVPDFVILGNEARWKGHGGAVAMGFLDHNWKTSPASYLP